MGIFDHHSKDSIDYIYDDVDTKDGFLAGVRLNKYWGAIDNNGKVIIPCIYDNIEHFEGDFGVIKSGDKSGLITNNGKIIISLGNNKITIHDRFDGLTPVTLNGKCGLLDSLGNIIMPFEYKYFTLKKKLSWVSQSVSEDAWKYAIMDNKGNILSPFIYDKIEEYSNGGILGIQFDKGISSPKDKSPENLILFRKKIKNIYQYIDSTGVVRITSTKDILNFNNNLLVYTPVGYNSYDYSGNLVDSVATEHLPSNFWTEDYNQSNGLWGIQDYWGTNVIPCKYSMVKLFIAGYAIAADKFNKRGVIDMKGDVVIPFKYEEASIVNEDLFLLKQGGKWAFADNKGKDLSKFKYKEISYYKIQKHVLPSYELNGFIVFNNKMKVGFCNLFGQELIPCIYDKNESFGKAWLSPFTKVTQEGKIGIVEMPSGKEIFPCDFDEIEFFNSTDAFVPADQMLLAAKKESKWGILDMNEKKVLIPFEYEAVNLLPNGTITAKKKGLWGTIDRLNNVIIPFEYDIIEIHYKDIMIVAKNIFCN